MTDFSKAKLAIKAQMSKRSEKKKQGQSKLKCLTGDEEAKTKAKLAIKAQMSNWPIKIMKRKEEGDNPSN
jgi:hypothetical protein